MLVKLVKSGPKAIEDWSSVFLHVLHVLHDLHVCFGTQLKSATGQNPSFNASCAWRGGNVSVYLPYVGNGFVGNTPVPKMTNDD
jgi:hypothetical protein